ncbi:MAG: small, acid-soluble spore protein, alpha/beta type [Clostridia bacterium]|nr:small, acid-soluble spore protein, alpha/beta type [Clostridia bacterium]
MSKNNSVVPQARAALDRFKMEAAKEVGVQSPLEENIHIL